MTLKVQGMTSKRITQQSRCISSIACCYPVLKADAKSDKKARKKGRGGRERESAREKYTYTKRKIFQEKLCLERIYIKNVIHRNYMFIKNN